MSDPITLSGKHVAHIEKRASQYKGYSAETIARIPSKRKGSVTLTADDCLRLARETNTADRLGELANSIKRQEYFDDVRGFAQSILDDLKDGSIETRDDLIERIDQDCDGAHRVIYTASAIETLLYSDNDSAYVDECGTDGIVSDGSINWSALAYMAFKTDVQERIGAEVDLNSPFECSECSNAFERWDELTNKLCPDCLDLAAQDATDNAIKTLQTAVATLPEWTDDHTVGEMHNARTTLEHAIEHLEG